MDITDTLSELRRLVSEYAPLVTQSIQASWNDAAKESLRFHSSTFDSWFSLRLTVESDKLILTAEGADDDSHRLLRNNLVGLSELRSRPTEHHLLDSFPIDAVSPILSSVAGWAQNLQKMLTTTFGVTSGQYTLPKSSVLAYWWDARANFGDAAGPWLIRAMTEKHVINARSTEAEGRALGSIGSLFQMLNRSYTDMWGSGILYPPTDAQVRRLKRLKGVRVHAVRGPKTRSTLQEKLGWEVPEIYGDPALLFPRYLQPDSPRDKDKISFVPHKHHWKYFKRGVPACVKKLSVADDVETVVNAIATSAVCISTSLHGIIFAQAYGVPWVWLNVEDDELKGGEFKFDDFFATLDADAVAQHNVPVKELENLDLQEVAKNASLPELLIDLDALESAFPLRRSASNRPSGPPRFRWSEIPGEERAVALSRVAFRKQERLIHAVTSRLKGLGAN